MGYIHCCAGLRKSRTYAIIPEDCYLAAQMDFLNECPICGHTVTQITRIDFENNVSTFRKTNEKARKLFDKLKTSIIYEKGVEIAVSQPTSKFYLYYNEFGNKKKCYSQLSSLKMGLFENKY